MDHDEMRKEMARRAEAGWEIPIYNTAHLKENLLEAGALLAITHWLLPDQITFDAIALEIALTRSQDKDKICALCGKRKSLLLFKEEQANTNGRGKLCKECAHTKIKIEDGKRTSAHWEALAHAKFSAHLTYPIANQDAYERLNKLSSFPGSMALANALLWWEQRAIPEHPERLTKADYFPLYKMHEIVQGTGHDWETHRRMMKIILNEAFHKHWQNLPGEGYRISSNLAHDGLEAAKLHDLITTFSGAIHKRLKESWGMFPDAPEDTKEIVRKVDAMSMAQLQTLSAWSDVFNAAFSYLKERVGGGDKQSLRPPVDEIVDMEDVFAEAAKWFVSWASNLGHEVTIRKEGTEWQKQ